ncbi:MAG: type I secretion system permease/ATPase [Campylobacterota bacterium]|nr:type I secretion system permease/ATPase [Campylobacterota bacterium]
MSEKTGPREADPLMESLLIIARLYNQPTTAETLMAGLPLHDSTAQLFNPDPKKAKSIFSRAAAKAGFTSRLTKKKLTDISLFLLPSILMLKGQKACVLLDFDENKEYAKIVLPDIEEGEGWISVKDLEKEYTGFTFLLKKRLHFDMENQERLVGTDENHWFWGTLAYSWKTYGDIIVASLLINLFVLTTPIFVLNVYDRVIPNNAEETLWVLSLGVVVIFLFDIIFKFLRSYFIELISKKNDIIISSLIFEKVMDTKLAAQTGSIGQFASHLKQYDHLRNFTSSAIVTALIDLPFSIIFLIVVYMLAGKIVIIPLIVIFLILIYALMLKEPIKHSTELANMAASAKNSILIESLNAHETIKTLNAAGRTQWKWEEATGDIAAKSLKSRMITSSVGTVSTFLIHLKTVAVIIYGVYLIKIGLLSLGGLIATMILSSRAVAPMGRVAALITNFAEAKHAYKQIDEIMKLPVEHPKEKSFITPEQIRGKIEFKEITFTYPGEAKVALNNLSFTIEPGEHVGIIGKMGSGKSTIHKLLMGLYDHGSGSILIDDVELQQYDPVELRKHIAYVPQDVLLFQGTIKENIAMKEPGISDQQIIDAAKMSDVMSYVNDDPRGLNMNIREKGENLSGGQRQSIAIARAFLTDFSISLLDEPTNDMDNATELRVMQSLMERTKNTTMLLVTHKRSLLQLVDRIIVLGNGEILLDGPKDEVLQQLNEVRT